MDRMDRMDRMSRMSRMSRVPGITAAEKGQEPDSGVRLRGAPDVPGRAEGAGGTAQEFSRTPAGDY
jgi:hypothetical protein